MVRYRRFLTPALVVVATGGLVVVGFALAGGTRAQAVSETRVVTSAVPAFEVKQAGTGIAGRFEVTNSASAAIALDGVNSGSGHGLLAWNLGLGRGAVIITSNSANTLPTLEVSAQSSGPAAVINANNTTSTAPGISLTTRGSNNPALLVNHFGAAGDLAGFQVSGANRARLTRQGQGQFAGGARMGSSGVAEALQVEGAVGNYSVGDVLVASTATDGKVQKSTTPYSLGVVGVYNGQSGVLLSDRGIDADLSDTIGVAILGVAVVNVSAENGAIHRGDPLVTSGTPGHAMLGKGRNFKVGRLLGKALDAFAGPGTGRIRMLVSLG